MWGRFRGLATAEVELSVVKPMILLMLRSNTGLSRTGAAYTFSAGISDCTASAKDAQPRNLCHRRYKPSCCVCRWIPRLYSKMRHAGPANASFGLFRPPRSWCGRLVLHLTPEHSEDGQVG